jgi:hypothetical protein
MAKDKIGPNQPCPCGSGQKYKKCCFLKGGRPATRLSPPTRPSPPRPRSYDEVAAANGIPPYAVARIVQERYFDGGLSIRPVLIADVRELSTEEIVSGLHALGIDQTQESFVDAARGHRYAWLLSVPWRLHIPLENTEDSNFAALAVCELWKRWCPDRPSVEMVDDWMHAGYECLEDGEEAEAYEHWWRVWEVVNAWLEPEMRTFEAAERKMRFSQSLLNWFQDFAGYWSNIVRDSPSAGERGLSFLRACLAQFPDEDPDILRSIRSDLAQLLCTLGQWEEGRALFEDMIAKEPRAAGPYAVFSDQLLFRATTPVEAQAAIDVLQRAKDAKVEDARDWDIDRRLQHAKERLRSMKERGADGA